MGINNNYPEIREGDRVSASQWYNPIADEVSRLSRARRARKTRWVSNGCGNFSIPEDDDGILFYNGSGIDIPAYGVALTNSGVRAAGGPDNVPNVSQSSGYGCQSNFLVNGSAVTASGDFGYAQTGLGNVFLIAWDTTDGFTPANGEMWGVQASSYLIRKNYGGFQVIGVYDSTNHWMLAQSVPMLTFRGKTTHSIGPMTSNGSFAINVYVGTPGSETQPAGNPTMGSLWNGTQCTINSGKMITGQIIPDAPGWFQIIAADTS